MFAMCSATDTYDIALAAENTDICDVMYDGDPPDPGAQKKLDFSKDPVPSRTFTTGDESAPV